MREGFSAPDDLLEKRARAGGEQPAPADLVEEIGGIRCLVLTPANARGRVLYFHGGGYRLGSPVAWIAYATRLAEASGAEIVLPFYRLSPEHPFPAALHDAAAVYRALVKQGPVVVAGDSAGAGLALALAISAHRAGKAPAGAVLVSPMLDFTASNETYVIKEACDKLFSREAVEQCAELYLQGVPKNEPLVSPLYADPQEIPPVLVLIGGDEVLLGEALEFTKMLAMADRRVSLHFAPGMGHVWPMMAPDSREAADAIAAIAAFVRSQFL
ncbi:MAG: alpha/beta hydrolase [Novosphingobium sp.]|nr:alpha/beta hydrolase [Novosphingobium sp.]